MTSAKKGPTGSRASARRKVVAAVAAKPQRGRPRADRVAWNAETFGTIYTALGISLQQIADACTDVSAHTIRRWQAPGCGLAPTAKQRAEVARALSALTGRKITAASLGRPIESVSFRFGEA